MSLAEAAPTAPGVDPLDDLDWVTWLAAVLPAYCTARFAPHHARLWEWVWALSPGVRPEALVAIFARGGAKSTSAEMACVAAGARRTRRYVLYVCDTQDRADDHVANGVGSMLESERVGILYPELAAKNVGKHGNSKGWRHNRLWTAAGLVVDAIGLDVAARGVKLEDQRPDLIVLDDIDGRHDSTKATERKITTLTEDILPAGADDVATLAIQNLVQRDGVFARLADGRAEFLARRQVVGPVPALRGFHVDEDGVVQGRPTWEGQSLEDCRSFVADWGIRSFRREAQHEVAEAEGALWSRPQVEATRVGAERGQAVVASGFKAGVVTVDPSGGDGPQNDEVGVVAAVRGYDDHGYVLADRSGRMPSGAWGRTAVLLALDLGIRRIRGERNHGGKMVSDVIHTAMNELAREGMTEALSLDVDTIWSSDGKRVRAEPVAGLFGEPEDEASWRRAIFHLAGDFPELESELTGWVPDVSRESPNRLDALAFAGHDLFPDLMGGVARTGVSAAPARRGSLRSR